MEIPESPTGKARKMDWFTQMRTLCVANRIDAFKDMLKSEAGGIFLLDIDRIIDAENGTNILHTAAANGATDVVLWLCRQGASTSAKSATGWTAMHYATYNRRQQICVILLVHEADPHQKDENDESCIDIARMIGDARILEILLERATEMALIESEKAGPMSPSQMSPRSRELANPEHQLQEKKNKERLDRARKTRTQNRVQKIAVEISEMESREMEERHQFEDFNTLKIQFDTGVFMNSESPAIVTHVVVTRRDSQYQRRQSVKSVSPPKKAKEIKISKKEKERLQREENDRIDALHEAEEALEVLVAVVVQDEETERLVTERLETMGIAELSQLDTMLDQRHPRPYDAVKMQWTCCGNQRIFSTGCTLAHDPFSPKVHDGVWVPGRHVWTCCGEGTSAEDEGCRPANRYIFTNPNWEAVVPKVPGAFRGRLSVSAMKGSVAMLPPKESVLHPEFCTIHTDKTLSYETTPSVCWEMVVDLVPSLPQHPDMVVVIGVIKSEVAGTAPSSRTFIGGDTGIGWWQGTPFVRGMGIRSTLMALPNGTPAAFGFDDSVTILLDFVNERMSFFLNRKCVGSVPIHRGVKYTPAVTVVPKSQVTFVHRGKKEKESATFVVEHALNMFVKTKQVREKRVLDMDDLAGI